MATERLSIEKRVKCVRLYSATKKPLTPPDFFLWGYLRDKIYQHHIQNLDHLQQIIVDEFNQVPLNMCRKACENVKLLLQACIDADGAQVDFIMENL